MLKKSVISRVEVTMVLGIKTLCSILEWKGSMMFFVDKLPQ